jgi:multiple sugar transport system permease protein
MMKQRDGALRRKDARTGWAFVSPWVVGFLALTAGPMLFSLYLSCTSSTLLSAPQWIGLENYREALFGDELVYTSLGNTAYYTAAAVPLSIMLALALALLLHQRVRGIGLFRTMFFLPSVTNLVAVSVLWLWMFNPEHGLLNAAFRVFGWEGPLWLQSESWSKPALILMSLWSVGGMMVIFLAALQSVPQELYDAARIDGASAWRSFRSVTVPMISPAILFNVIVSIIGSFQVFTQAFVMTGGAQPGSEGGPNHSTLFFVLYLYKKAFQEFRMGYASALSWLLFAVVLVFTLALMRLSRARVYYETGGAARL